MMDKPFDCKKVKTVGVIAKRNIEPHKKLLLKLERYFKKRKIKIVWDENTARALDKKQGFKKEKLLQRSDMAITLGGDGTLLKTARRHPRNNVPILAVNLGTLGFLTETTEAKLFHVLKKIFDGYCRLDRRSILRVTLYRKGKKHSTYLALNDAAINQGAFARLIQLKVDINQRLVNRFKADGLIVATPTGSTGHSLSAGGPIVHPHVEGFIFNPVNPVSLSMRPIILPENRQINIHIETERRGGEAEDIGLTLDGQELVPLKYGDEIKIRKSKRNMYLIREGTRYYKVLRNKLNWGGEVA
jgi:NAD+ kinase